MTAVPLAKEPLLELDPAHAVATRQLRRDEIGGARGAGSMVAVVEPCGDRSAQALGELFAQDRQALLDGLRRHGCILFRGFDVDRRSFEEIVSRGFQADRYVWMLPLRPGLARALLRTPLVGWLTRRLLGWIEARATGRDIVEEKQSTLAADQTIQFPHHEYGIFFNVPRVIAFHCEKAAGAEGETVICDAHAGYRAMRAEVRARFEAARFIRYRSANQWYLPPFTAPAVLHHPVDGSPSMNYTAYSHTVAAELARERYPQSTITNDALDATFTFEPSFVGHDGQPIAFDEEDVREVARAHFDHSLLLRWRQGDLLLMDNFRVVHGRLNGGFPRKVLQVILCDYLRNRTPRAR